LNSSVEKPVLRVTDIEHFHWSLSEADLPESTALDKPVSLAAAVELALIEAHYRTLGLSSRKFNFAPNCSVYTTIKAANWPSSKKANSKQTDDIVVIVLPGAESNSWWIEQLQLLKSKLTDNLFPPRLATALTGGVAEMVDNAWLHSASDQPALLAYQVRNRRFAFSVADMGIGILRSLKQNPEALGRQLHLIAVGGRRHISFLAELAFVTVVNTVPFMRTMKRRRFHRLANNWKPVESKPGEALDDLWSHNSRAYSRAVSQEFRHFKRQNLRLLNTDDYGIAETPIETGALHDSSQLEFWPIADLVPHAAPMLSL